MPKGYPATTPFCTIEGCGRPHMARGWCGMHYKRWKRHGEPLKRTCACVGEPLSWLQEAVAAKDRATGCWEWPFAVDSSGYGELWYQGTTIRAHVLALILDGQPKPQPPNHLALHSCDNRPCCNPTHLRWGTLQDNIKDAMKRGRLCSGEDKPNARFTNDQIRAIRTSDQRTAAELAAVYGVTQTYIYRIRGRFIWKNLSDEEVGNQYGPPTKAKVTGHRVMGQ